jgi:hypothetical protein
MYLDRADLGAFTFVEKMKARVPILRAKVQQVAFGDLQVSQSLMRHLLFCALERILCTSASANTPASVSTAGTANRYHYRRCYCC